MPFKNGVEQVREEFVKRVLSHEKTKKALCEEYHISRPTGDRWIKRYLEGESLSDRSRSPNSIPNKTNPQIEKQIIDCRKKYPALGAVKLHQVLTTAGMTELPSTRTINEILKRNNLITKEASLAATPIQRFVKEYPNEMWQGDFFGHFAMANGNRCHPLNIIYDYSRYCICCGALSSETYAEVKIHMERAFREYGMPFSFLCDNGNPWGTSQSTGFTHFEVWLMDLGILTLHGRIKHPQTQGKAERFNGTFNKEFLKYTAILDEQDAEKKFSEYRDFYNNTRPHHALNLATPAEHYERSSLVYPEKIEEWEYPKDCEMRAVKSSGYFNLRGQGYFLSEALGDKQIAVRESEMGGSIFDIYYRKFRIARVDVDRRIFTSKKAFLLTNDPRSK